MYYYRVFVDCDSLTQIFSQAELYRHSVSDEKREGASQVRGNMFNRFVEMFSIIGSEFLGGRVCGRVASRNRFDPFSHISEPTMSKLSKNA